MSAPDVSDALKDLAEQNRVSPAMLAGEVRALLDILTFLLVELMPVNRSKILNLINQTRLKSSRTLHGYLDQLDNKDETTKTKIGIPDYAIGHLLATQELSQRLIESLESDPPGPMLSDYDTELGKSETKPD